MRTNQRHYSISTRYLGGIAAWIALLVANLFVLKPLAANVPLGFHNATDLTKETLEVPALLKTELGFNGAYRIGDNVSIRFTFETKQKHFWFATLITYDGDGNFVEQHELKFLYGDQVNDYKEQIQFNITGPRKTTGCKLQLAHVAQNDFETIIKSIPEKSEPALVKALAKLPKSAEWIIPTSEYQAFPSTKEVWLSIGAGLNLKGFSAAVAKDETLQPAIATYSRIGNEYFVGGKPFEAFRGIILQSSLQLLDYRPTAYENNLNQLADWVKSGGSLFLVLHQQTTLSQEYVDRYGKYWNVVLPGKLTTQTSPHTNFSGWETFLATDEPLVVNEELRRNPPLIPVLSDIKGKVLLSDGDTPLVIEHQLGLGRVVTCLVDLNAEPWRGWKKRDRDELLQRLIPWHITTEAEAKFASSGSSLRLGYDDLAGQFVTAMGTFPSVRQTPFWVLMSAALGFGAVWYFAQSMLLKTWSAAARLVMAAFVVAVATLGFALLTGGFVGESRLLANSAQVVDYNAMQGEYQGQSWLSIMSTAPRQIDLQASVTTNSSGTSDNIEQQLAWLGMPGKGWGGLDAPLVTWTQGGEPYQIDSRGAAVTGLTLSPDLTKSFHERWRLPTNVVPTAPLVSHPGESLPRGTLKSELPFALQDAILVYDTWGAELGTVQPGQVIDLEQIRARIASAGTIISGKRIKPTEAAQSYDRANTDVPQILKLLLLNRAAGGTRFTGLFSRAWPLLDQSGSLTANQALVLGRGPAPVKWKLGPAGEQAAALEPASEVCWYRLWLPVVPSDEASESNAMPTMIRLPGKS